MRTSFDNRVARAGSGIISPEFLKYSRDTIPISRDLGAELSIVSPDIYGPRNSSIRSLRWRREHGDHLGTRHHFGFIGKRVKPRLAVREHLKGQAQV